VTRERSSVATVSIVGIYCGNSMRLPVILGKTSTAFTATQRVPGPTPTAGKRAGNEGYSHKVQTTGGSGDILTGLSQGEVDGRVVSEEFQRVTFCHPETRRPVERWCRR
jgi:hypothetical protein